MGAGEIRIAGGGVASGKPDHPKPAITPVGHGGAHECYQVGGVLTVMGCGGVRPCEWEGNQMLCPDCGEEVMRCDKQETKERDERKG